MFSCLVFRQKSLLITSLSIGKQYQLRVTAGNLYGFGLPSTPVPVEIDASKVTKSKVAELESVRGKKIKVDDYDKYCECKVFYILYYQPSMTREETNHTV